MTGNGEKYRINPEGMIVEQIQSAPAKNHGPVPATPPTRKPRLIEPPVVGPMHRHAILRRARLFAV